MKGDSEGKWLSEGRGKSKCKEPEARACLLCLIQYKEEARVAGVEKERRGQRDGGVCGLYRFVEPEKKI